MTYRYCCSKIDFYSGALNICRKYIQADATEDSFSNILKVYFLMKRTNILNSILKEPYVVVLKISALYHNSKESEKRF